MVQVLQPEGLAGRVVVIEETSRQDGAADFPHQLVVEPDVMLSHQLPAQGLLGFGQVMQVGAAVFGADGAGAGRIGREVLEFVDAAPELDDSPGGEESAAFGHLGWNDAVEHIDPAVHRFQHIQRSADPHQIAGTVGRKQSGGEFAGVFPLRFFLPDGQSPDGKSVKGQGRETVGAFLPEIMIEGALDDGEHGLQRVPPCRQAAFGPPLGDAEGGPRRAAVGGGGNALVQHHHDVAADAALGQDGPFRAEQDGLAIHVALENRTLLTH